MEKLIKHKHFLWATAAVILILYNAPSCRTVVPYRQSPQPSALAPAKKAAPAAPALPPKSLQAGASSSASAAAPASPASAAADNSADAAVSFVPYFGEWQGHSALPQHRLCTMHFELRGSNVVERPYAGYSTLTCTPVWPFDPPHRRTDAAYRLLAAQSPMSAILTGGVQNGSVKFHVDKTLNKNCPMTALTLMPFGTKQIAVQWDDELCGGGYMVLSKLR